MTYRDWLKKNYRKSDTAAGDLCRDMEREYEYLRKNPLGATRLGYAKWKNSFHWIKNHLYWIGADAETLRTFTETWVEYRREAKNA